MQLQWVERAMKFEKVGREEGKSGTEVSGLAGAQVVTSPAVGLTQDAVQGVGGGNAAVRGASHRVPG